ncbi:unnamed protein product [Ilex paraguariensis]|uniref:Transcription repressor n=1 Tax=Ilex paraguariensis TaxID=185542 RepID=A0ABC8SD72_9AQUA
MGNYRFRLSDMLPNTWFYKLKDLSRTRNKNITQPTKKKHQPTSSSSSSAAAPGTEQPHLSQQRKSYYFTRELTPPPSPKAKASDTHFPDPPRKSSKNRRSTKRNRPFNRSSPRLVTSSVSAGCSCRATLESIWNKPDSPPDQYSNSPLDSSSEHESLLPEFGSSRGLTPETFDGLISWSASCHCGLDNDIIIDIEKTPFRAQLDEVDGFDNVSELNLPPIITKPANFTDMIKEMQKKEMNEPTKYRRSSSKFEERNAHGCLSVKFIKEDIISSCSKEQRNSGVRRYSVNSPGVKLRTYYPRIASRRSIQGRKSVSSSSSSGRSLSDSLAIMKSSQDPQRDFRESMVEMIMENKIRASKDLEDLLACYLSLNSDEYHELIIGVFKQIWFDISDIRLE